MYIIFSSQFIFENQYLTFIITLKNKNIYFYKIKYIKKIKYNLKKIRK